MPGESKPQWAVRHFGRRQTLPGVGSWSRHKTMQDIFSECRPCGETAGCKSTWCHTWVDSGHIACLLSRIVRFAKSKRRKPRTLTKWSGLPVGAQCALQKTQSWLHMKQISFLLLVNFLQSHDQRESRLEVKI